MLRSFVAAIAAWFQPMPVYGRLKTDQQVWGKVREVKNQSAPPATVPLNNVPRVSKDTIKLMAKTFLAFVKKINGDFVFKKLMIPAAGWLNTAYRNGKDQAAQALGFAGNVFKILKIVKGPKIDGKDTYYGLVEAMHFEGIVPNISFESDPWLIHFVTISKRDGWLGKLGKALNAFIVILKRTEVWVDMERVELFPPLPRNVEVKVNSLHVRQEPSKSAYVVGGLIEGDIVQITEYAPRGRNVWGRVYDGWICLQDVTPGRIEFFTNWKMATPPPPM